MIGLGRSLKGLLQRFVRSQRGNVAMMAGIALPVLLMISAGAIDLHHIAKVRSELQDALDAATLAAARSNSTTAADVQNVGMASLRANMPKYFGATSSDVASFTLSSRYQIEATATVQVKTIVANIFLPPYGQLFDDYMPMSANSQVLRASRHVELAMALDVTGSMEGSKLRDLKAAAHELIGIVIQGDQTVFQTRIALVPYARGVNMGTNADLVRGKLTDTTPISGASWAGNLINISNYNNGWFRSSGTVPEVGQTVYLTGFNGNSGLSDTAKVVSQVSGSEFKLTGVSGTHNAANNRTRQFRICERAGCSVLVKSVNHNIVDGEGVVISGVEGLTQINGIFFAKYIDKDSFAVSPALANYSAYTKNGTVQCGRDGCAKRIFLNRSNNVTELVGSTCVSERPRGNSNPSESLPTASNWVGRAYMPNSNGMDNGCQRAEFLPLTNVVSDLTERINSYTAAGATAGQVGIEMAWYAISPVFSQIFSDDKAGDGPVANVYDSQKTIKAVVLMTDGEFNTPFCQGVVARDAGSGSVSTDYQINCNSVTEIGRAHV